MSAWLLDTNVASHIIRNDRPAILRRLVSTPVADVCISAVTEAELLYGLAKRQHPPRLTALVSEFLVSVDILPWDSAAASAYANVRAGCEAAGWSLGALDSMIAAHAMATGATLVTRDVAFARVPGLKIDAWED